MAASKSKPAAPKAAKPAAAKTAAPKAAPATSVTRLKAWPKSVAPVKNAEVPEAGQRHFAEPMVLAPAPAAAETTVVPAEALEDHSSAPPDAGAEYEPGDPPDADEAEGESETSA